MLMKLGGRKNRDNLPSDGSHQFDERTFNATIDLLEVFTKKSASDTSFGTAFEAPVKDIDAIVINVLNGDYNGKTQACALSFSSNSLLLVFRNSLSPRQYFSGRSQIVEFCHIL